MNRHCAKTDKFVFSGACPRPWERLQFIRGTENAMLDIMDPENPDVRGLIKLIHDFNLRELEFWVNTDIDAIGLMDDWGSQNALLIPPAASLHSSSLAPAPTVRRPSPSWRNSTGLHGHRNIRPERDDADETT